ncbi:hypothetical protein B0J18DRAFT_31146 [Chaetomium sp. MPI-SDFR-AT-0129]|nr:hypothetical protein B0J18DRAFT_31146 [Chaetomium sp. MPI-SDFR-AT-0129]
MGKPRRAAVLAAAQESTTPPDELTETQFVARIVRAEGNSLYTCELPNGKTATLELEPKFRNTIFVRRGGYVLVDLASAEERLKTSKVMGEIINIVRDEKAWRKQPYWPKNFVKNTFGEDEDDDSTVGKLPPSDSDEE